MFILVEDMALIGHTCGIVSQIEFLYGSRC